MAEIRFRRLASKDFEEAFLWYAKRSKKAANRFRREVEKSLERILSHPELYELIDEEHRRCLMRRYPFSIVYRIEANQISIVALIHARRSEEYWKHRL